MKIVAISDLHTKYRQLVLPEADVLVIAGDVSYRGTESEIQPFCDWLDELEQFRNIVMVAGNHDWGFEKSPFLFRSMVERTGTIYLENQSCTIDGIKFWGSPVTPWFYDWAFNVHRGEPIKRYWDQIPMDTDVLITHGPPKGHGDFVENAWTNPGQHVGCEELNEAIKRVVPQVHFFGHIHEGYGVTWTNKSKTACVNCSVVNSRYHVTNPPMVFELTGPKSIVAS